MDNVSSKLTRTAATNTTHNNDRRGKPRYPFIANAEQTDLDSGARVSARVSELSLKGCYLDTLNPFPKGTQIKLLVFHGDATFTALATVVYLQPHMGMGVQFSSVEPRQLEVLRQWLDELSESVTSA